MPGILRAALQKGAVMGDVYAAISADQAVNLAPPDSPSPFLISNSPGSAEQPRGCSRPSLQPGRRGGERGARGREAGSGGGGGGRGATPSKTLVFYYTTSKLGYQA